MTYFGIRLDQTNEPYSDKDNEENQAQIEPIQKDHDETCSVNLLWLSRRLGPQ
jgi:hypothetical protein